MGWTGRQRRAIELAVALFSVAFVAYLAVGPGSARSVNVVDNLVQLVVPATAAVLSGAAAARTSGRLRGSWVLIAAACASWTAGQAVWTWYEVVRSVPVPNPSWADLGYLLMVPLLLVGLVRYPVPGLLSLARLRLVLDAVIIGSGLLFVAQATVLEAAVEQGGTPGARIVALTYPLGDVAALAIVGALLIRRHDGWHGPLPRLVLGLCGLVVADLAYVQLTATSELGDHPLNAGWVIGFAIVALAATRVLPEAEGKAPRPRPTPARLESIVPALPVGAAAIVLLVRTASGAGIGALLGLTGTVLLLALAGRHLFAQLENHELTGDLRSTVAELQHREDELEHRAFHDPLTGLANRDLLRDRLEHALARRRHDPVAVVFVDLDEFKGVNDSLGHDAGDHILVLSAERLRASVRAGDTVARLGGDEFAVLVDDDDGSVVARRILAALDQPFPVAGREVRLGGSVGVAVGLPGATSASQLLQDADLAMYAAKAAGKGRVAVFEPAMREGAVERLDLLHDLDAALDRGELVLHFQPVHHLRARSRGPIAGYEALLRWQHPEKGLLAPASFLALAEETGRIVPIGWWVLEEACRAQVRFPRAADGSALQVGVNLSARQLVDPLAPQAVAHALAVSGADPGDVFLEVPESALLDGAEAEAAMASLRALGVRLVIDDFGSGYSSLPHLGRLPADVVKIDRTLVSRLASEPGPDDLLIGAVVQVAKGLGLATVAEGVEEAWQLARLADLGIDAAQGFLLGAPAPLPGSAPATDVEDGPGDVRRLR